MAMKNSGVRRLAMANGPNIFQMLLVRKYTELTTTDSDTAAAAAASIQMFSVKHNTELVS